MGSVTFEKATEGDVESILQIMRAALKDQEVRGLEPTWRTDRTPLVRESVAKGETLLVYFDGKLAGSIALKDSDPDVWPDDQLAIYLNRLVIDPVFRGHKLGNECVTYAEQIAAELGKTRLRLNVVASLTGLINWYRSLGFIPLGELKLPAWTRTNLLMEKVLRSTSTVNPHE